MTLATNKIGTPKRISNEIRQKIQSYRESMSLSREQISKEIGIGHSTYYNAIQHNNKVRPLQYDKIVKYYKHITSNNKKNKNIKQAEEEKVTQIVAKGAIKIIKEKDKVIIEVA